MIPMENTLVAADSSGILDGMKDAIGDATSEPIRVTMDAAGRVVLPKGVRDRLGLGGGAVLELAVVDDSITLSPAAAEVRLRRHGRVLVAEHVEEVGTLSTATVARITRELRERRG